MVIVNLRIKKVSERRVLSLSRAAIIAFRMVMVGVAIFFLYHSVTWHSTGESSSIAVYSMKVVAMIVILPLLMSGALYFPKDKGFLIFNSLVALTFVCSLVAVNSQTYFSMFYFLADSVGFLLFWIYAQFGYMFRAKCSLGPSVISKELSIFLVLASIIIIFGFIQSGGEKVSIPPDIHFALVFCFLAIFLKEAKVSSFVSISFVLLIAVAAFLSLHESYSRCFGVCCSSFDDAWLSEIFA